MKDEMEYKDKEYCSLTQKYWRDLLSTMEAKENRNRTAAQIKRLSASKTALDDYDSNASANVPHKKKVMTGILPAINHNGNKPLIIKVLSVTACCAIRV